MASSSITNIVQRNNITSTPTILHYNLVSLPPSITPNDNIITANTGIIRTDDKTNVPTDDTPTSKELITTQFSFLYSSHDLPKRFRYGILDEANHCVSKDIMNARVGVHKGISRLVHNYNLEIVKTQLSLNDNGDITITITSTHYEITPETKLKSYLSEYVEILFHYPPDDYIEFDSFISIALTGELATGISSTAQDFFEYVTFAFLNQLLRHHFPPVEVTNVIVTSQRLIDLETHRDRYRGVSRTASFHSCVEISSFITAKYLPPPETINSLDKVLVDSLNAESEILVKRLTKHPSFEGLESIHSVRLEHFDNITTLSRQADVLDMSSTTTSGSFFSSYGGIVLYIFFALMAGVLVLMVYWYKQGTVDMKKKYNIEKKMPNLSLFDNGLGVDNSSGDDESC